MSPPEDALPPLADREPPPELWREIELALLRATELAAQNRQLDFGVDPGTGRIVIRLLDLDGEHIRFVTGTEALDIIAGAELR